jgi:sugar lactone lactonase YvrE
VKIDTLVNDGNLCGEAPLWDAYLQRLYWTDITRCKFYSYDWNTKRREVVLDSFEVSGCSLDDSGALIFVNQSGVWSWDRTTRPKLVVDNCGTEPLQLNDCIADPKGRLLTGSCFYSPTSEYSLGKLYSVGAGGSVEILDEGFHLVNGLGFSRDGRTLYVADSVAHVIYAYIYNPKAGQVRERRIFVQVDINSGLPDGLTVDDEDFVWSAEWYGSCIKRYDPEGRLERRISIPAKQCSSLTFGGPSLCDIFVTSAAKSEPMPVMPADYDPETGYFGGALFHLNVNLQGRLEHRTKLHIDPSLEDVP